MNKVNKVMLADSAPYKYGGAEWISSSRSRNNVFKTVTDTQKVTNKKTGQI